MRSFSKLSIIFALYSLKMWTVLSYDFAPQKLWVPTARYDMIALIINATESLITWRSQSKLITCVSNHSCSQRDNKKCSVKTEHFLNSINRIISLSFSNTVWYREYRVISFDIVHFSCDIVRYREYREYRRIKCCTKFAPKSHQRLTPIQLDKLEFVYPF